MMFFFTMLILVLSATAYQVLQKQIAPNVNPVVSMLITYIVGLAFTLLLFLFYPLRVSLVSAVKEANYASYLLGFTVVGIELGYLLVYRYGWKLGLASPFQSAITTVLLVIIALFFFREHLSPVKLLGIAFCLVGIVLMNIKD
jgi:multidrug transporter EmrE-like cation transporter